MTGSRPTGWLTETSGGFRLQVRVTPKASRDEIGGVAASDEGDVHLRAQIRAAPEKGKANRALAALIAKRCGVAKSGVRLVAGEKSRLKILEIEGHDETVRQRLLGLAG